MKNRIDELLEAISNNNNYRGCVFEGAGIYFVIHNGEILEISDDASDSPKGGWFPDIVTGPTEDERACMQEMMDKLGFDEDFFSDMIDDCMGFSDEEAIEYFEGNDDEDSVKIYKKIKKKVMSGTTPFDSIDAFVAALSHFELDNGILYYDWEGEYIDLYDNICDTGETRGYYDNMNDSDWIELLENIDEHVVKV